MPDAMREPVASTRRHRPCRALVSLIGALALAGSIAGCAKARAEAVPEMPALAVPPPPPRVLPPLEGEPIDAAVPAPTEPQTRPRPPRQKPDPTRGAESGSERADARGESGNSTPPAAETAAPPEAETAQGAPALQLAPAGDGASEQNTRRRLAEAEKSLLRVDYRLLNTDAKAQYDTAKRFIVLAEQAIVERNLLFAHTLADKAATIATVLQRR
jgi:hypothetical protein